MTETGVRLGDVVPSRHPTSRAAPRTEVQLDRVLATRVTVQRRRAGHVQGRSCERDTREPRTAVELPTAVAVAHEGKRRLALQPQRAVNGSRGRIPLMSVSGSSGASVAIVTGGASGIGRAMGLQLGRRGVEVVVADRQTDLAAEVARDIEAAGGRARAVPLDVRDFAAFRAVVDDAVSRGRRLEYLFNNAGIGVAGEMDGYSLEDWNDVLDVNLRGVVHGIQCAYGVMIRQGSGHIVNTASMAGLVPAVGEGSYTATKYAVVGLSRSLRIEAKRHGVRVSVLCPGAIRTPILSGGKFGRINVPGITDEKMRSLWEPLRPMDVDVFARRVLAAIDRNEAVIIEPPWWRALWYLKRFSPAMSSALWGAGLRLMRRRLAADG